MKKITSVLAGMLMLSAGFIACDNEENNVSPYFAYVEVLDEDLSSIEDCSFTATYDGESVSDFHSNYYVMTDEDFNFSCKLNGLDHIEGFTIGKAKYEVGTDLYSEKIMAGEDNETVMSKFLITVSKSGYESQTFTVSVSGCNSYVARKTVTLKKE